MPFLAFIATRFLYDQAAYPDTGVSHCAWLPQAPCALIGLPHWLFAPALTAAVPAALAART